MNLTRVTPREQQILELICEGHANNRIAEILEISVKTVQKHREKLNIKLGATTPAGLVMNAVARGLVKVSEVAS